MDCVKQINDFLSEENHVAKSQISSLASRNSTKVRTIKQKKPTSISGNSQRPNESSPKTKVPYTTSSTNTRKIKSEFEPLNTKKVHSSKKMSDWSDEETAEVAGKRFGKTDEYKKRSNGNHNGGGRGRGLNGNEYNRYNKNIDNEENGECNVIAETNTNLQYQYSIFARTPNDFLKENVIHFVNNMREIFQKSTMVQKYSLMKYLMDAYEKAMEEFNRTTVKQGHIPSKTLTFRTKETEPQHITSVEPVFSPTIRTQQPEQEILSELHTEPVTTSLHNDKFDLLQIFQQDYNKYCEDQRVSTAKQDNRLESKQKTTFFPPSSQMPSISDLLENNVLNSPNDSEIAFIRHPPKELKPRSLFTKPVKNIQQILNELQAKDIAKSQTATANISYYSETLSTRRKRLKPRNISEEEYSLRFRLPRRKFSEIGEMSSHIKYNKKTSAFAYFPMDMSLIEEEYSSFDYNHMSNNSLGETQLQSTNTLLSLRLPHTLSTLATTNDNIDSLNIVRQAPSRIMDMSSLGRPLLPPAAINASRIEEEHTNDIANDSYVSISSRGAVTEAGEKEEPEIMNEVVTLPVIQAPPQITTADSGINFPTPNLLTADRALIMPSISNVDSGLQTVTIGHRPAESHASRDTGVFKTPLIPPYKLLHPTTLPSVEEEHLFQSKLKKQTLNVSTPVTVLDCLNPPSTVAFTTDINSETIEDCAKNQISQVEQSTKKIRLSNENNLTMPDNDDDDYRKDWYEILRTRLQNANYKFTTCTNPKSKRKLKYLRKHDKNQKISNIQQNQLDHTAENYAPTSVLLQQTLAGILPSPSNREEYDRFIFENAEDIGIVIDNLDAVRVILANYRRGFLSKLSNGTLQKPRQHFDPEILLNAPKKRLAVKLGIIQNIVRNVSFDFTKCTDFITDRMSAAIGFAFLLELKSAGIINLSKDGRIVSLR